MKSNYVLILSLAAAGAMAGPVSPAPDSSPSPAAKLSSAQVGEIRKQGHELLGTLPDKAPGSEKDTPELVALGKKLYFEKQLSENGTMSCNSCHQIDGHKAGVDGQPTSPGAFGKRGDRNSPTVLNAALQFKQFWDGRAASLEEQAKGPILNPIEMAMPSEAVVLQRLRSNEEYQRRFARAFPGSGEKINYDNVAEAIAAFERTLVTKDRVDDFLKGQQTALNDHELQGMKLFLETGCTTCHNGPLLGGNSFQKVGLVHPYDNTKDVGRLAVSQSEDDKYKFKVPTLRNVALTGPYFHDGAVTQLPEAVRRMAWMQLGLELPDGQVDAIVAFLQALTDKQRAQALQMD